MIEYVAHSKNDEGQSEPLAIHLSKTAQLAEQYADAFHEGVAGAWAGWFHDAGKASALFQDVLRGTEHRVNHAAAGAAMLYNVNMQIARAVYGHHDGLIWSIRPDLERSKAGIDDHDSQEGKRFAVFGKEQYYTAVSFMHSIHNLPKEPPKLHTDAVSGFSALPEMLHTRMLLSCLCDADYTATASHYDPSVWENTEEKTLDAPAVLNALTDYRKKLKETSTADPKLNAVRDSVYQSCLDAADHAPGMFTLTAPTGTGKTLALLAFAARHAHIHHKRRIIIVLPFLSIVSQNAAIYRKICGEVLESHSMISYGEKDAVRQLADQWNAPVVVTTSVKFFEVFFKYKPSDLRFLHSIANSVIVFDEAQSIPRELTGTTLETMRCLCETFRCTVLFSTATQPAFDIRKDVQYTPYEILHAPEMIYAQTKRVSVDWRTDVPVQLDHIAAEMAEHESVCCVLNRKDHTHKLFELLREICPHDECYHISTDMCKAHRDAVLHTITERLKQQLPCRLVSTSCIEAGVDLDFAVMYRALAPLEAIVQCAGRCNRNGKGRGSMTVFIPDKPRLYPTVGYENAAGIVKLLLTRHPVDIHDPAHIREYYTELFSDANYDHDKADLVKAIADHDFAETERHYRFIPQSGVNVLVPYQGMKDLFDSLAEEARSKGISKDWMHRAAPLTVAIYQEEKLKNVAEQCRIFFKGRSIPVPGWYLLLTDSCYDEDMGLYFTEETSLDYLV